MRKLAVAIVVAALAAVAPAIASAATTTFKGRFACVEQGVEVPIADARVEPYAVLEHAGEVNPLEVWMTALPFPFGGPIGRKFVVDEGVTRDGHLYTDAHGGWSFEVTRKSKDVPGVDVWVRLVLNDDLGTSVSDYPSVDAVSWATDTNLNDLAVQDYGTIRVTAPECAVWLGLKRAGDAYKGLSGRDLPLGRVHAQYGAPNLGSPVTLYDTIAWPAGYPPEGGSAAGVAATHEFAHLIRNAGLGGAADFLDEVGSRSFWERHDPCTRTTPGFALHEGWAEFWAGDFAPAPPCPGVPESDQAYEANVAWALTRIERGCATGGRRHMAEVLLTRGKQIHSLADFQRELGGCQGVPLDPGSVPRSPIADPVRAGRWVRDLKSQLRAARGAAAKLDARLDDVRRASRNAHCLRPPCVPQLERKLAPALVEGGRAQARLLARTLADEISPRSRRLLEHEPTLRALGLVRTAARTLTRGLARIGLRSLDRGLHAARPIIRRDHSRESRMLLKGLRSLRSVLARARQRGSGLPAYFRPLATRGKPLRGVPSGGLVSFTGIPDGTLITTQTASQGATFGSAAALGFPAAQPAHTCPAGPTASGGAAVAPDCPASIGDLRDTGTMARLSSSARSVTVSIGSTQAQPGGFAANLQGFDADGHSVARNAVLVGASTNGQGAGPVESLAMQVSGSTPAIAYVALYFDGSFQPGPRLVLDNLAYTGP